MVGDHSASLDCCTAPFCDENKAPLVINVGAATSDVIKEVFDGLVAPEQLNKLGTSEISTRVVMVMLASGAHDFQSPAFAKKFELAAAYCSSRVTHTERPIHVSSRALAKLRRFSSHKANGLKRIYSTGACATRKMG
jgi:hypothetical protein